MAIQKLNIEKTVIYITAQSLHIGNDTLVHNRLYKHELSES